MSNRILVIGANGMLGGSLFRHFSIIKKYSVIGTVRNEKAKHQLKMQGFDNVISKIDIGNLYNISDLIKEVKPNYILNCVGIIKQRDNAKNNIPIIEVNSLFPHKLASMASHCGAKLIHFSTDCVFSGTSGNYRESDVADSFELYGRSKLLGEVDYDNHLTLRTSIIGHELGRGISLVDWFLNQNGTVFGFKNAIFSGLPTCYMASVIEDYILSRPKISGLYHLSVDPIDKFTLLEMINDTYGLNKIIKENVDFKINRSLNSDKLNELIKIKDITWNTLIKRMHDEYINYFKKD
ncbi:dTDP-4-dehydrorhamnose reductase family protein [Yersinia mollaretii]|uniref:dTDP-4-dehydrorhamnose reductase family protein n=1 Tax=Yersinia mollaretii TaxID=33060 RepID=UPI0025AA7E2C|nr:SDR family oxidoreductase [Yersinia mollaretii]MDN0109160.1 SDR family oxidoreductase [Yersinia mollaretii]